MVNTIARRIGLNPSSNGQLMKTALEADGLAVRRVGTRLLGLRPQRVANSLGGSGALAAHWSDLDAAIDNRALESGGARPFGFFQSSCHELNMRFREHQCKFLHLG